jgi:hypothetical protein
VRRLAALALLLAFSGSSAQALRLPGAPRCPIFPPTNPWNMRVDTLPVAANSDAIIQSIGPNVGLHPDFGSGLYAGEPIGIPYTIVRGSGQKSRVPFEYADESDKGPYPIPKNVPIEGGRRSTGDRHALIVDKDHCRLYELYALYPTSSGWKAGSGAIWDLRSNKLRPAGWTSADAAGLPIFPGLARYDEVARGVIDHALRFTVQRSRRAYIFPARHYASNLTDANLPPMGLRVRLKAGFDVSGFPQEVRVILVALKRYGMIVADNGSNWFISGAPSRRWSNDDLHTISRVKGSDFEVVQTGPLTVP